MNRRYLLIFTIIALLLVSCEANLNNVDSAVKTASVTLKITNNTESRSILPEVTNIASYSVTLQNKASTDVKYSASFKEGENITIDSVLIGEYTVTVDGCSDADASVKVATGTTELIVKTEGDNTASVTLDWLEEGTGAFSVDIDWAGLTKEDNLLYKAIEGKSLGFQAWDTENNKAFNGAGIQWAKEEDFTADSFKYTQTNIPTSKDNRSTNISFRIYSKMDGADQVIAETFYTTVTIYANITSYPDENESFSLKNDNIVYYLKNVTNVTSSLNSEDSAKKVDVSWNYPSLNEGKYLLKVWITNNDKENEVVGEEKKIEYSVLDTKATGVTTATFDGLDPEYTYTVHFINYTNDTNLVYSYSAEITPLEAIRTKVKVSSISFQPNFATSYVMGGSVTVNANITPGDATITGYTVSAPDLTVTNKTVTFDKSGDYTITITSDDEDATQKTTSTTVTVRLATPQDFSLKKAAEGIALSWSSVDTATSYSIKKTSSNGVETLATKGTSYTDSSVKTGVEYTYSVKAEREDTKFDSDFTEEKKETIKNTFITVTAPTNVTSENFKPILETALKGQFITDLKGITVTIDTSSSTLLSSEGTTFTWLLNGGKIGAENSKTVDIDRTNVDINAHESSNSLQLVVTKDGIAYSAAATVHYIETDPGELTITTTEDTVTYGEDNALKLETATANGVGCAISWTSSNPKVATVDSDGRVTALIDGSATITATIVATGKSATKTIKTYIPVGKIEMTQSSTNWLIIPKNGVSISNSNYRTKTLTATVKGVNEGKATDETLTWSISSNNSVDLSCGGSKATITSKENGSAGSPKVTVSGRDGVSESITIAVYDFDVKHNGTLVLANGGGKAQMKGSAKYPENKIYIVVNNVELESSSDSNLRNLASYSWAYNPKQSTSFEHSESTYYATMKFGWNDLDCGVTVTVEDDASRSVVGTMSFKRVGI